MAEKLRVGVLFGGRSAEHEVSLASAANVMDALQQAGHEVVPIGITPQGKWLTGDDPHRQLRNGVVERPLLSTAADAVNRGVNGHPQNGHAENRPQASQWALLPQAGNGKQLPAIDVIFPVLHGPYGEDGTVQGMLAMADLPYVGCEVLASAAAMDKATAKKLFALEGLPQVAHRVVLRKRCVEQQEAVLDELEQALAYPLFVKPSNMGSSVGVSKASTRGELAKAVDVACRYDRKIIVEEAVPNAREIEVSVLGNDAPVASLAGEILPSNDFYDYAAKYEEGSGLVIPAEISLELMEGVRKMAVRAFNAIDGAGLARVDFLLDGEREQLYLNEVNTMPGFTIHSMYPKLWAASGVDYPQLVDRLIALAMERHSERQQNEVVR